MDVKFFNEIKKKHPKAFDLLLNHWDIMYLYEARGIRWLADEITNENIYGFFDSQGIYGYVYMEEDGMWFWEIREGNEYKTYTGGGGGAWNERGDAELALFGMLFETLEKR